MVRAEVNGIQKWSKDQAMNIMRSKQRLDIRDMLVLLNRMEFKGSRLRDWSDKPRDGSVVPELWKLGLFAEIDKYITEDRDAFFQVFGKLSKAFSRMSGEWRNDASEDR